MTIIIPLLHQDAGSHLRFWTWDNAGSDLTLDTIYTEEIFWVIAGLILRVNGSQKNNPGHVRSDWRITRDLPRFNPGRFFFFASGLFWRWKWDITNMNLLGWCNIPGPFIRLLWSPKYKFPRCLMHYRSLDHTLWIIRLPISRLHRSWNMQQ